MAEEINRIAHEAVNVMWLDTDRAISFILRHTNASPEQAAAAVAAELRTRGN